MKRRYWILPGVLWIVAAIAFGVSACADRFAVRVRNDTDGRIFVYGMKENYDLNYGTTQIDAHSTGRLHTPFFGYPNGIDIGSYDHQWSFTCDWSDAKAHEPVVVTVTTSPRANGNGYTDVTPHATCNMTSVRIGFTPPDASYSPTPYKSPTPVASVGAMPLQLPGR